MLCKTVFRYAKAAVTKEIGFPSHPRMSRASLRGLKMAMTADNALQKFKSFKIATVFFDIYRRKDGRKEG